MAPCAVWLLLYYTLIPAGEGAGFVLFPMLLLCGAGALTASVICCVSALAVLFVKSDSNDNLEESEPEAPCDW